MTDEPEIAAAEQRAVAELTRLLRGWATGMQDPHAFAEHYVLGYLRGQERWHPPLRPPGHWHPTQRPPGAGAGPSQEYLQARARHGKDSA